ncbi:hypothetical protein B9G39_27910 [Zooshikella ganghwensis]|uniref:Bacteriophage lambda Replication protein O N-terminal domain-containing protein n=2 Tax=Zooshikella ganghwensis TaxID=202772 RepID=A0A4P9VGM9_9GAMM|nr:hypothetical protein B9G39_27910 [Zooshikella ganghwensis]
MSQANSTTLTFQAMLDDGFIMTPNGLLNAIAELGLSKRKFLIFVFVFNKTFGFRKAFDRIALSQFVDATGIAKQHISQLLKELVSEKILIRQTTDAGYLYGINPALLDIGKQSKLSQHKTKKVEDSVTQTSNQGGSLNEVKRVTQTGNHNNINTKI